MKGGSGSTSATLNGVVVAMLSACSTPEDWLVTAQIGGMDGMHCCTLPPTPCVVALVTNQPLRCRRIGKSNDPIYAALTQSILPRGAAKRWVPMVFEPVASNFERLQATYTKLAQDLELSCTRLLRRAVSYGDGTTAPRECIFFEYNDDPAIQDYCDASDWMKVGLLYPGSSLGVTPIHVTALPPNPSARLGSLSL